MLEWGCTVANAHVLVRWTRQWTSEENRHGDLMNKYCYLSGKVNMRVRPFRGIHCLVSSVIPWHCTAVPARC